MLIFVSPRNLGDAVIHARMIEAMHLNKREYVVVTNSNNANVFNLFGIIAVGLDEDDVMMPRILRRIVYARNIAKFISSNFKKEDQVVFLYGDSFDRLIKFLLAGRFTIKAPVSNISSITLTQKSRFKLVKNVFCVKASLLNYYCNLSEYLGLQGLSGFCFNKIEVESKCHRILIVPYASMPLKNIERKSIIEIISILRRKNVEYAFLVEESRINDFKLLDLGVDHNIISANMDELSNVISRYSCIICADSFIMHFAGAFGKKCLVFTGANKPYYWLHEYAEPIYSSGGCPVFPCSNFPIKNCGNKCKQIHESQILEKLNDFFQD